jgi:hypothetical protein
MSSNGNDYALLEVDEETGSTSEQGEDAGKILNILLLRI